METYIALLLMIVPGFIAREIYKNLSSEDQKETNLSEIVYSLIFSIFIILLNYIFIKLFGNLKFIGVAKNTNQNTLTGITNLFQSISFIIFYIVITIVHSIFIGYMWNIIYPFYLKAINFILENNGGNELTGNSSLLSHLDDGKEHILEITTYKDGKENTKMGFSHDIEITDGKLTGISLIKEEKLNEKDLSEYQKETYIDFQNLSYKITEFYKESEFCNETKLRFFPFIIGIFSIIICWHIIGALGRFVFHLF